MCRGGLLWYRDIVVFPCRVQERSEEVSSTLTTSLHSLVLSLFILDLLRSYHRSKFPLPPFFLPSSSPSSPSHPLTSSLLFYFVLPHLVSLLPLPHFPLSFFLPFLTPSPPHHAPSLFSPPTGSLLLPILQP